jgi:outer membrane protein TolC
MTLDKHELIITLLVGLIVFNVSATNAETLEDAWNIAIDNNHQIKSAKANTSASEQDLYSAKGQRLPELNIDSGYTQFSETPAQKVHFGNQSAQFNIYQAGSVKAQAIASVPIFTSGRITHNINAAEAALQASQNNEISSISTIKMLVSEAYISVLRKEGGLKVAQSHVDNLSAHAQDVKNLHDQGLIAKNDYLAASVELANAQQLVIQVKNQLDIARSHYNQLMGRSLADDVQLSPQFPEKPAGLLTALNNSALIQRSELLVLTQQIEALYQQAESIKAANLPQVSVDGGYQYHENRYQVFQGLWMVNVGMQWKVFDGSTQHNSEAINRQAISLEEQRNDLTSVISLQVRQAFLDSQEAQKRIEVTQKAIAQADENMKVTTDRYQQGLSTNTDVIQAEELRTRSYDNFNNANYDATLSNLHLRHAIGVL